MSEFTNKWKVILEIPWAFNSKAKVNRLISTIDCEYNQLSFMSYGFPKREEKDTELYKSINSMFNL